jgi:hypothetical protein
MNKPNDAFESVEDFPNPPIKTCYFNIKSSASSDQMQVLLQCRLVLLHHQSLNKIQIIIWKYHLLNPPSPEDFESEAEEFPAGFAPNPPNVADPPVCVKQNRREGRKPPNPPAPGVAEAKPFVGFDLSGVNISTVSAAVPLL